MEKMKKIYEKHKCVEKELNRSKQENIDLSEKLDNAYGTINKHKTEEQYFKKKIGIDEQKIGKTLSIIEKNKREKITLENKIEDYEVELCKANEIVNEIKINNEKQIKEADKKYKCVEDKFTNEKDNLVEQINKLQDEIINIKAEKLDIYESNRFMTKKITQLKENCKIYLANFNKVMVENDKLKSGEGVPDEMKKSMILTSQLKDIFNEYKSPKTDNEKKLKNRIIELETEIEKGKIYSTELIKEYNTLIYSITTLEEENDWYRMQPSLIRSKLPDENKSLISLDNFYGKRYNFTKNKEYYIIGKYRTNSGRTISTFNFKIGLYSVTNGVENLVKEYPINFFSTPLRGYYKNGYYRSIKTISLQPGKYVLRSLNNIVFKKKVYFKFEVV